MTTKARIRLFAASVCAAIAMLSAWGLSMHAGRPLATPSPSPAATAAPAPASPSVILDDDAGESE
jgi:hypothetical protein